MEHGETALILPCLGRTEVDKQRSGDQFVTVENSAGVVHKSEGSKMPVSQYLLSEPRIVAELANTTIKKSNLSWLALADDYDQIRNLIEKTIPGFENFNERVRKPGGFYLPNGAREGFFNTVSSKALFTINRVSNIELADDQFLMMTIRSHDQFNTTIYGLNDRYRGIHHGRRVIFMNEVDMINRGLRAGDRMDICSGYNGINRQANNFVVVPYNIPTRCVATYFPEANTIVPHNQYANGSQTPISKSVIVKLSLTTQASQKK